MIPKSVSVDPLTWMPLSAQAKQRERREVSLLARPTEPPLVTVQSVVTVGIVLVSRMRIAMTSMVIVMMSTTMIVFGSFFGKER